MLPFKIDRNSSVPLYAQVRGVFKTLIAEGYFDNTMDTITEEYLQKEFDISRNTVRQALADLEAQGLIVREKSRGIKIIPDASEIIKGSIAGMCFTEYALNRGMVPKNKILRFEVIKALPKIAGELHIPKGEMVFYLKRLRFVSNKPVWVVESYIPLSKVPRLSINDFEETGRRQSLFYVLENVHDLPVHMWIESIKVTKLVDDICEQLKIECGSTGLLRMDKIYLRDGCIIAYNNSWLTPEFQIHNIIHRREKHSEVQWPGRKKTLTKIL